MTYHAFLAVILAPLYLVEAGVRPVEFFSFLIDGQTIGRTYVGDDDVLSVLPAHPRPLDAGRPVIPVSPKDESKQYQGKSDQVRAEGYAMNFHCIILTLGFNCSVQETSNKKTLQNF